MFQSLKVCASVSKSMGLHIRCQVYRLPYYYSAVTVYIARANDKLISCGNRILLTEDDLTVLGLDRNRAVDFGYCVNGARMCLLPVEPELSIPDGYGRFTLRELMKTTPEPDFRCVARGVHLAHWDRTHRYCGSCGTETVRTVGEYARSCPSCGAVVYPRISPAIIVAVVRDGRLLLAHNARRGQGFYSVIAGFVDPGETLEECVAREVREETGIEVQDIRYVSSQPWPFPDSLMIAYVCDYRAGEIQVDGVEIDHAYWCAPDELPDVPPPPSVARTLIDWFTATYR